MTNCRLNVSFLSSPRVIHSSSCFAHKPHLGRALSHLFPVRMMLSFGISVLYLGLSCVAKSAGWKAREWIRVFTRLNWQSLENWRGALHFKVKGIHAAVYIRLESQLAFFVMLCSYLFIHHGDDIT